MTHGGEELALGHGRRFRFLLGGDQLALHGAQRRKLVQHRVRLAGQARGFGCRGHGGNHQRT